MNTIVAALPTPFHGDGSLDIASHVRLCERISGYDVDAFVAGTTGEFPTLSPRELARLVRAAIDVLGPDRVVAHVGAPSAAQAVTLAGLARESGASRLAAISPYPWMCGPAAVEGYYRHIAGHLGDAAGLMVYVLRGTSTPVAPTELARLARIPGVCGAKLSGYSAAEMVEFVEAVPAGFEVFSARTGDVGPALHTGIAGAVLGSASVFPEPFAALAHAIGIGDAAAEQAALGAVEMVARHRSVSVLKAALHARGIFADPHTRGSLDAPTPEQQAWLAGVLAACG